MASIGHSTVGFGLLAPRGATISAAISGVDPADGLYGGIQAFGAFLISVNIGRDRIVRAGRMVRLPDSAIFAGTGAGFGHTVDKREAGSGEDGAGPVEFSDRWREMRFGTSVSAKPISSQSTPLETLCHGIMATPFRVCRFE